MRTIAYDAGRGTFVSVRRTLGVGGVLVMFVA